MNVIDFQSAKEKIETRKKAEEAYLIKVMNALKQVKDILDAVILEKPETC